MRQVKKFSRWWRSSLERPVSHMRLSCCSLLSGLLAFSSLVGIITVVATPDAALSSIKTVHLEEGSILVEIASVHVQTVKYSIQAVVYIQTSVES